MTDPADLPTPESELLEKGRAFVESFLAGAEAAPDPGPGAELLARGRVLMDSLVEAAKTAEPPVPPAAVVLAALELVVQLKGPAVPWPAYRTYLLNLIDALGTAYFRLEGLDPAHDVERFAAAAELPPTTP